MLLSRACLPRLLLCRTSLAANPHPSPSPGPPIAPQVTTAYQLLDDFHHGSVQSRPSVMALLEEAEALRRQQDLFELYVSEYVFLQRCTVRWGQAGTREGQQDHARAV